MGLYTARLCLFLRYYKPTNTHGSILVLYSCFFWLLRLGVTRLLRFSVWYGDDLIVSS